MTALSPSCQHKKEKKEKKEKKHKKHKKSHHGDAAADLPAAPAKVDNPIGDDDYFAKTAEFQMWLKEARGAYLDELPSEEARRLFKERFVPVGSARAHTTLAGPWITSHALHVCQWAHLKATC